MATDANGDEYTPGEQPDGSITLEVQPIVTTFGGEIIDDDNDE